MPEKGLFLGDRKAGVSQEGVQAGSTTADAALSLTSPEQGWVGASDMPGPMPVQGSRDIEDLQHSQL